MEFPWKPQYSCGFLCHGTTELRADFSFKSAPLSSSFGSALVCALGAVLGSGAGRGSEEFSIYYVGNKYLMYQLNLGWWFFNVLLRWFSSNWKRTSNGWWYTNPSEKIEFVSWDDEIPNIWKNMFRTTNQFTLATKVDDMLAICHSNRYIYIYISFF